MRLADLDTRIKSLQTRWAGSRMAPRNPFGKSDSGRLHQLMEEIRHITPHRSRDLLRNFIRILYPHSSVDVLFFFLFFYLLPFFSLFSPFSLFFFLFCFVSFFYFFLSFPFFSLCFFNSVGCFCLVCLFLNSFF